MNFRTGGSWPTMVKANLVKDKPKGHPDRGPPGLPADFLISPDGGRVARRYGAHTGDQWSVYDLLALTRN